MSGRSPLARYLEDRHRERGESPDTFARRAGINSSGYYRFLRGETTSLTERILQRVAATLGMTPGQLLEAAEGPRTPADSEKEVLRRLPEFRAVLEGVPRQFWPVVIRNMLSAGRGARDLLDLSQRTEDTALPASADKRPGEPVSGASADNYGLMKPRHQSAA
jgi:transcriptional regulator with XRE-family HTH domain